MNLSREHPLGEPVSKESIREYLEADPRLMRQFLELNEGLREEFIRFCSGASGLKICYDPVFKFILDPEHHPERLSEFLSVLLKQKVSVKRILSREGERLLAKGSLVIMDLVVELEDGSLATVEIQKIPHAFPGPRAACYSSDLVLRQYSKARDRDKKNFSYRDLKKVYTIVILENSSEELRKCPDEYIHHSRQRFNTKLELNLLQEYVFVTLDGYKKIIHNKVIEDLMEAWLGFLSFDEPERIWEILSRFPQFKPMYQELADFRGNIGEVLMMFSKELAIMDWNNVRYMIDEDREEIKRLNKIIQEQKKEVREQKKEVREQEKVIREKEKIVKEKDRIAKEKDRIVQEKEMAVMEQRALIEKLREQLAKYE